MQNQSSQQLLLLTGIPSGQCSALCSSQLVFFSPEAAESRIRLTHLAWKMSFKCFTSEMSTYELMYILTIGNARVWYLKFTLKILGRIHLGLSPKAFLQVSQKNRPSLSKLSYFHLQLLSSWVLNAFENMMKATDPLPGKCTEFCTQFQRVHGSLEPCMKTSP